MLVSDNEFEIRSKSNLKHLLDWAEFSDYLNKSSSIDRSNHDLCYELALYDSFKRVISCLINEKLVNVHLITLSAKSNIKFVMQPCSKTQYTDKWVVLESKNSKTEGNSNIIFNLGTEFAIHYKEDNNRAFVNLFVDPDDISNNIFVYSKSENKFELLRSIEKLTKVLLNKNDNNEARIEQITDEIQNSLLNQAKEYNKYLQKNGKTLDPNRTSIEYEQNLIHGHHTHPMNKARFAGAQLAAFIDQVKPENNNIINCLNSYDYNNPKIYFYKIDKKEVLMYGKYDQDIQEVAQKLDIEYNYEKETIIPVHELNISLVEHMFKHKLILVTDTTNTIRRYTARAQSSLRTVNISNIEGCSFKLPLPLIISSALRTITPWTIYIGPHINLILDKILEDKKLKHSLDFLREKSSITLKEEDMDVAKYLGCIIRQDAESKTSESSVESLIMCGYLTEKSIRIIKETKSNRIDQIDYEYNINNMFNLYTQEQKERFGFEYVNLIMDALFTPVYKYGLAFEAHLQNVLLKIQKVNMSRTNDNSISEYKILGFVVRDFGGIKVHQDTLYSKIGLKVPVLNDEACVLANDLDSVYKLCYHTLFHCHLQTVFRALNMHYNNKGWQFVYNYLISNDEFNQNKPCREFFLNKFAPYKCFISMKINSLYREYLYSRVPNMLTYHKYNMEYNKQKQT